MKVLTIKVQFDEKEDNGKAEADVRLAVAELAAILSDVARVWVDEVETESNNS